MDDYEESTSDGGGSEMSFDSLVNNTVMYIVGVDEFHFPIKRSDITQNALTTKSGKKFQEVMQEVKKLLEQTFGLILVDLDGTDKLYVTVSKFTRPGSTNLLQCCPEQRHKRVLLLIVLSYVYMMDNSVSEDNLWEYLTQLKLIDKTVNLVHPQFGDVQRLCTTDFVHQMYLKTEKVAGTRPPEYIYMWGPRANAEFNKLEVLKFVALMQSNIEPQRFTSQWSKIEAEENNVASGSKGPIIASQPNQARKKSSRRRRRK